MLVEVCCVELIFNVWFDGVLLLLKLYEWFDLGIVVDILDGLFVLVLCDVGVCLVEDLCVGMWCLCEDV